MPLWKLYYHFVWATHERLPLITPIREAPLYQFIHHKTDELGGRLHAIGGIADHLHQYIREWEEAFLALFPYRYYRQNHENSSVTPVGCSF